MYYRWFIFDKFFFFFLFLFNSRIQQIHHDRSHHRTNVYNVYIYIYSSIPLTREQIKYSCAIFQHLFSPFQNLRVYPWIRSIRNRIKNKNSVKSVRPGFWNRASPSKHNGSTDYIHRGRCSPIQGTRENVSNQESITGQWCHSHY